MNRSCLQIGLSVTMLTLAAGGIADVTLTTMSFQDSLRPILPGWGRHFWNQKSVVYQHPPAFDFTNVANAVAYRFDILDDRHDIISFTAPSATAGAFPRSGWVRSTSRLRTRPGSTARLQRPRLWKSWRSAAQPCRRDDSSSATQGALAAA